VQASKHAQRTEIEEVRVTVYVIPSENIYTCRVLFQDRKYGNFTFKMCICKILPEDGPYRPKHVVMIQV
jgi:hypothetical protein